MRCTLVLPLAKDLNNLKAPLIGIDYGAYLLAKSDLDTFLAIGDFDSCTKDEIAYIKAHVNNIIELKPEKDDTDTFYAIKYLQSLGYDEFHIVGGIGKRIDHTIANILLMESINDVKIILEDQDYRIQIVDDILVLSKYYKYVSIFPLVDSTVTLTGFKYPLNEYKLLKHDILGTSNEIISLEGIIQVNGKLLVVETNE